jgi:dihydrofolate synthase/folylpolyglutamate synthase
MRGQPNVDRVRVLTDALGRPQHQFEAIHVTGTNGKGSTAKLAAALLAATGRRVGLYTSPHLHRVNERISVNGEPISDGALSVALERVRQTALCHAITATWFEVLTAAALWHFAETRVDAAVVEVGMLGRWDATNVIDGCVAVVTNVELDHTEVAGPTRTSIAAEKAGIIRCGVPLVLAERSPDLRPIFEAQRPSTLLLLSRDFTARPHRSTSATPSIDLFTPRRSYTHPPGIGRSVPSDECRCGIDRHRSVPRCAIAVSTGQSDSEHHYSSGPVRDHHPGADSHRRLRSQ